MNQTTTRVKAYLKELEQARQKLKQINELANEHLNGDCGISFCFIDKIKELSK